MKYRGSDQKGFTAIEMLIVVVVVGILAAIAFPSYVDQVRGARRSDAKVALVGLASALQRFSMENGNTFAGSADASKVPTMYASEAPLDGSPKYYNLRIESADAVSYDLRAIPKGDQAADRCGTLTLNHLGVKGVTGADAGVTADDCW